MLVSFVHSSDVSAMVVLMLPCAAEWYQMFLQWQNAPDWAELLKEHRVPEPLLDD